MVPWSDSRGPTMASDDDSKESLAGCSRESEDSMYRGEPKFTIEDLRLRARDQLLRMSQHRPSNDSDTSGLELVLAQKQQPVVHTPQPTVCIVSRRLTGMGSPRPHHHRLSDSSEHRNSALSDDDGTSTVDRSIDGIYDALDKVTVEAVTPPQNDRYKNVSSPVSAGRNVATPGRGSERRSPNSVSKMREFGGAPPRPPGAIPRPSILRSPVVTRSVSSPSAMTSPSVSVNKKLGSADLEALAIEEKRREVQLQLERNARRIGRQVATREGTNGTSTPREGSPHVKVVTAAGKQPSPSPAKTARPAMRISPELKRYRLF